MTFTKKYPYVLDHLFLIIITKVLKTLLVIAVILFLPLNAMALSHVVQVDWEYPSNVNVDGFGLYHDDNLVCTTYDPNVTSLDCRIDVPGGETKFFLTAFYNDGTEGPRSAPYSLILPGNGLPPAIYHLLLKPKG